MVSKSSKKKRSAKIGPEQESVTDEKNSEKRTESPTKNGSVDVSEIPYVTNQFNGVRRLYMPLAMVLRSISFDKSKPAWARIWAIELFHWLDEFIVSNSSEEQWIVEKMTDMANELLDFKGLIFDYAARNKMAETAMPVVTAIAKLPSNYSFCSIFERLSGAVLGLCNYDAKDVDVLKGEIEKDNEILENGQNKEEKRRIYEPMPSLPAEPSDSETYELGWMEKNFSLFEAIMRHGAAMKETDVEIENIILRDVGTSRYRRIFKEELYRSRLENDELKKQISTLKKQNISLTSKQQQKEELWKGFCDELKVSHDVKSTLTRVFKYYTEREKALEAKCAELTVNCGLDMDVMRSNMNTLRGFCNLASAQYDQLDEYRTLSEDSLRTIDKWENVMELNSKTSMSLLLSVERNDKKITENQKLLEQALEIIETSKQKLIASEQETHNEIKKHKSQLESYKKVMTMMTNRLRESQDKELLTKKAAMKMNDNLKSLVHILRDTSTDGKKAINLLEHYYHLEINTNSDTQDIDLKALVFREEYISEVIKNKDPVGRLSVPDAHFFVAKNLRYSLSMMILVCFYTGERLGDCMLRWADWYESQAKQRKGANRTVADVDVDDISITDLFEVAIPLFEQQKTSNRRFDEPAPVIAKFRDGSMLETSLEQTECYQQFAKSKIGERYFKYARDFLTILSIAHLAHFCDMETPHFVGLTVAQRVNAVMVHAPEHSCNFTSEKCPFQMDNYAGQFYLATIIFHLFAQEYGTCTTIPIEKRDTIDPSVEIINDSTADVYGPKMNDIGYSTKFAKN